MLFAYRRSAHLQFAVLCLLLPLEALAQATRTELAGNPLPQFPFFEYVRAFNVNAPVDVAIDPTRFPAIVGDTCDVYVVNHKTDWATNPGLVDVTPGGALTRNFVAGTIQANTFEVAAASTLNANAGAGLGVPYDVVLDCDQNGSLSTGDFIDGLSGEAGLYMVHDVTAAGPHAVTEEIYNLDSTFASGFGIPGNKLGEDLYFPTNAATMGKLPVVIISRGNGHDFRWYDHIGNHLASYGYVVMSHDNNTEPGDGTGTAMLTTIGHTDAFIAMAEGGTIAGGSLVGHIDARRIVWIGHSRGAEGVARAYHRLFAGTSTPTNYSRSDIKLVSSMLPTDFGGPGSTNPHDVNYHLWTASGDADVSGAAECFGGQQCQTFHIHDRATRYRQSTIVQGAGHGSFHDGGGDEVFAGPCPIGRANTHLIQQGHFLALVKHYVEGNIPALDFLTRQYESFHPIGVDTSNPCIVVSHEYRNGAAVGNFIIDDYQTNPATDQSSSGGPGSVTFDVEHLTEDRLDDNNSDFAWNSADPFNGATQASASDDSRGVVFDWTGAHRFYEWAVPTGANDFNQYRVLSLRGAQGTQHPNTLAATGDLTFTVTLRDGAGVTSSINIGAYGGGLEEPYARNGGWHNEMETLRFRILDFLNNGSALNLANIVAVRLDFGPGFGSNEGRIVIDELMLTNDLTPFTFRIIEPTTARPRYAGTSVAGSRVLVRLVGGGGLDMSAGNMTISVAGVALTPAQIPTPASQVGGETWIIISPGPRADGCYDLAVALTTPTGVSDAQPQSLCYSDDETHVFDRVLAVDQTNSMNYDGRTNVASTAKMDAARAAAKFFVDLSNPLDKIGIISFQRRDQDENGTIVDPDELAEPRFNMIEAGEGGTDQRPAARTALDGIAPDTAPGFTGPETSPGAGLVEARTMLDAGAVAGHEPNIVLLTDGLENYAPFWNSPGSGGPLRPVFDSDDIRVDAVGVGQDADDALLADIAAVTGGEFRNLNEGSGSFELLSRLADWYKLVDEDVRGEQRFYYAEGLSPTIITLSDKQWHAAFFDVEPQLDWMTVAFHSNLDGAVEVRLLQPGSSTPIVITPPTVTLRQDGKHSVYRIRTPAAGRWVYMVHAFKPNVEFFAVASALTSLTAKVGPRQLARRPTGDYVMPLRVWIAERQSILGASVSGTVRRPDGVKIPVTLIDDGLSMDGRANDGIYGLGFVASIPGAYYVSLKATGTSSTGIPFERYPWTSFVIAGQPKRPKQPGEGGPTSGGTRCSCEQETRYSLAVYAGKTFPQGSFNTIADSSTSFGVKAAQHFAAFGGRASLGFYLGRDNFDNAATGGSDFHLTHLSPELEIWPWQRLCPKPSLHIGVGAYRDENGNTEFGFNAGFGLMFCLTNRVSLLGRYDYRSVNALSRDYSTLQLGLRWSF
jgi:hypothetical protein